MPRPNPNHGGGDAVATRLGTGRVGAVEADVDGEGSEEGDKGEADGLLLSSKTRMGEIDISGITSIPNQRRGNKQKRKEA